MLFPKSTVDAFVHVDKNLRYGQAFYQFMKLEKCEQDRDFCDRLYNASDTEAKAMIASRIDYSS